MASMAAATATDTQNPVFVTVSALEAGQLTLPERLFVTDADPDKRATVPSLAFLIRHPSPSPSGSRAVTNLVFDLGIKRDLHGYRPRQQEHIAQRQPVVTDPDCAQSLRRGNRSHGDPSSPSLLDPATDIDFVVLSHVHWDHVGTPSDFPAATFLVGSGTLDLLRRGAGPLYPADLFNPDELPADRTIEFPPVRREASSSSSADDDDDDGDAAYYDSPYAPRHTAAPSDSRAQLPPSSHAWRWQPLADGRIPHALDLFGDASVWVVDSPGHLYGHVNLLARTGPHTYVYLGGDCCHDPRILRGDKGIALYDDGRGQGRLRSVHTHTGTARRTLDRIRAFLGRAQQDGLLGAQQDGGEAEIEVVLAHDGAWRAKNGHRFWPGRL